MKKIKLHVFNESVGLQAFNRYYAYRQSASRHNNYQSDVELEIGPPEDHAINIAFSSMPKKEFCDFSKYDLILFDNAGEPLEVSTPYIADQLRRFPNTYFLTGAFVDPPHQLSNKIISFNHNIRLFHDCITRGFYPQYFDRADTQLSRTNDLCYINGSNRSNRQYMMDLLSTNNNIHIKSSLGKEITEIGECQFEDQHDNTFRHFANGLYQIAFHKDYYHTNGISIGIGQSHGQVSRAYFMLDEYYKFGCVLFPESQWINNQHFMTEKIFKCFVAGTIPWPIAGANLHKMYNHHGYRTAWNLLPPEHQLFDEELDHARRYQMIATAAEWLSNNKHVLSSDLAKEIIQTNSNLFFANTIDVITVKQLDCMLNSVVK